MNYNFKNTNKHDININMFYDRRTMSTNSCHPPTGEPLPPPVTQSAWALPKKLPPPPPPKNLYPSYCTGRYPSHPSTNPLPPMLPRSTLPSLPSSRPINEEVGEYKGKSLAKSVMKETEELCRSHTCRDVRKHLDSVKFLSKHCRSVCENESEMYSFVIDRMLDPVYEVLGQQTSTDITHQWDLMPGNLSVPGGSSSAQKVSASPNDVVLVDNDTIPPISVQKATAMPCVPDNNSVSLRLSESRRLIDRTGLNALGTFNDSLASTVQATSSSRPPMFSNPSFPEVSCRYLGCNLQRKCTQSSTGEYVLFVNSFVSNYTHILTEHFSFFYPIASDVQNVFNECISVSSNYRFEEQSLFCILEEDKSSPRCDDEGNPDALAYISYERNFEGQIYLIQDLKSSDHFTVPSHTVSKIHDAYRLSGNGHQMPYLHVPNTSNYVSPDNKFVVINNDDDLPSFSGTEKHPFRRPIETVNSLILSLFHAGISDYFHFDHKKRSSVKTNHDDATIGNKHKQSYEHDNPTKKRGKRRRGSSRSSSKKSKVNPVRSEEKSNINRQKQVIHLNISGSTQRPVLVDPNALPVLHVGYSTQDCHQYGSNMATVCGNVKPFVKDSDLPIRAKKILVEVVETVLTWLPSDWAFNIDRSGNEALVSIRKEMISDLKYSLCKERGIDKFRIEGITVLIPLSIGKHKDTMNCSSSGMSSVVSINAKVPMNQRTIPDGEGSKLWRWLNGNGYFDSFPCSIILYSRKHIYHYSRKMARSLQFASQDLLRKSLHWAFIERVGTVTDYRSRIWNNDNFPSLFKRHSKKMKTSRFKGLLWTAPACYDKTVRTHLAIHWFYVIT